MPEIKMDETVAVPLTDCDLAARAEIMAAKVHTVAHLRQTRHRREHRAHDELYAHPRLAGLIQIGDHLRVRQIVQLDADEPRGSSPNS